MGRANKYSKYLLLIFLMCVLLLLARNLIITGSITGSTAGSGVTVTVGVLDANSTVCPESLKWSCSEIQARMKNRFQSGTDFASNFFDDINIEILLGDEKDIDSMISNFKEAGVKAMFDPSLVSIPEEMKGSGIPLFHMAIGISPFSSHNESVFSLQDNFFFPMIVIADSLRKNNVSNVGLIYVKSALEAGEENFDYSDKILNMVFENIVGNVMFNITHEIGTTNITQTINIINSERPEAIVFGGFGTYYSEFSDLLFEISEEEYAKNLTIYSLKLGSRLYVYDFPMYLENFKSVYTVEIDPLPENFWRVIFHHTPTPKDPIRVNTNDIESIHLDSGENEKIGLPTTLNSAFTKVVHYPFTTEGYIFAEILRDSFKICDGKTECMKEMIHNKTFSTAIGKIKFRKNGYVIRPYFVTKVDINKRGGIKVKRYTLGDMENIISKYNLTAQFLK